MIESTETPMSEDPGVEHVSGSGLGNRMWNACGMLTSVPKNIVKSGFDRAIDTIDPAAATHLINSSREFLMAIRSFVDAEIRMADKAIDRVQRRGESEIHQEISNPPSV